MAQPDLATCRIVQKYTIDGLTHKLQVYARNLQLVGGVYKINSRTVDANDTPWVDAANGLFEAISYNLPVAATHSAAELWEKVSNAWILRGTFTTTSIDHKAGGNAPGWQTTAYLRDANFRRLAVVMFEGQMATLAHYTDLSGMPAGAWKNMLLQFTSGYTVAAAPYIWMVSKGNAYINTSGFIGATAGTNRKVRRARGLT